MISFHFETQRRVFVLLAAFCCCNCVPLLKTVNMVDSLRSASESSSTPDIARLQNTVMVDLGALLDAGDGAVEKLVAGSNQLTAHGRVLTSENFVSAAIIRPDMREASDSEIDIPAMESPVLRQLAGFRYTDRTLRLPGMAAQLLPSTENFGVSALKDSIDQQLAEQLSVENAAATAVLGQRYSSHSLRKAAVAFIRDHLEVLATQGWAEAVLNHPGEVVQISQLLGESSTETSNPAAADSTFTSTAAAPSAHKGRQYSQPPGAAAVSLLRKLSDEEKGWLLREAARQGAVEEVRQLLAAGADVESRDSGTQETPLHIAAANDRAAMVPLLLEASADLEARNKHGHTPLQVAAWWGQPEAAIALLNAGADKGARGNDGLTTLEVARSKNHPKLVEILQ